MIHIDELWVMQQSVERGSEQVDGMIDYVKSGGLWTIDAIKSHSEATGKRAAPIYITQFPDGERMIHDGHKRVMSTQLGGRHYLLEEEYLMRPWTYESYDEVVPERGFVTPFDPKTEVRLDDFLAYKNYVLELAKNDIEAARKYVAEHPHEYKEPRRIKTVAELALEYAKERVAA